MCRPAAHWSVERGSLKVFHGMNCSGLFRGGWSSCFDALASHASDVAAGSREPHQRNVGHHDHQLTSAAALQWSRRPNTPTSSVDGNGPDLT